jgi:hypothetical protein
MKERLAWNVVVSLFTIPLVLLGACGGTTAPYSQEREMQSVIFVDQERQAIERWLTSKGYHYGPTTTDNSEIGFNIRGVSSSGLMISIGIGGRVKFDANGRVEAYSIERHLTGP